MLVIKRLFILLIFVTLLSVSFITSNSPSYPKTDASVYSFALRDSSLKINTDYIKALNVANRFLIAWLNRDASEGALCITENMKNSIPSEDLKTFFIGQSNPHHHGFEILGFKRSKNDRIIFQIWLYEHYTGEEIFKVKLPSAMMIDVVKIEDKWLVDSLPKAVP